MLNKENWITYKERKHSFTVINSYQVNKEIKKATIYIASMGWYNLYINNVRVDSTAFSTGWTNYKFRVQYQSYDITKFINDFIDIKVDLGEGWGGGNRMGNVNRRIPEIPYSYWPISLNYSIEIEYSDGETKSFNSDESCKLFSNEISFSNIYDGERQDYRLIPTYISNARHIDIDAEIIPQEGEDIVFGERIPAKDMFTTPKGELIIDFGQNFCGNVEINIKGSAGDEIEYTPGEVLDKDGNFYNENYRSALSTFSFVLNGEEQVLMPKFSFLGGRYIKLNKYPNYIKKENFTAVLIHSNMKQTCFFKCGNEKIQRLYLNAYYGQLGNYLDIPTDCPQRDERLGWTADTQVFTSTGAINFDVHKFFVKWVHDLIIDQLPDGGIRGICPDIPGCNYGQISTGWGDACTVVPYEIYKAYGDKELLKESIPMMEKWIEYLHNHEVKPYLTKLPFGYSDWLALDHPEGSLKGLTDQFLIDNAFYAYSTSLLIDSLKALHMDASKYENILKNIKEAYISEFIKDGHMVGEKAQLFSNLEKSCYTQTGLVLTLHFGLYNENDKQSLLNDLVGLIKECGNKMSTGFLGTPYIMYALSDNGYTDVAYSLLFQEEYPSWLYSVNNGATTFWEHYDGIKEDGSFWDKSMNSFNHYAYGVVFGWIFNSSVGIRMVKPEYEEIIIAPIIDRRLGYIDCVYKSKFGDIHVKWDATDKEIKYEIDIPYGIKAHIILENGYVSTTNKETHIKI